MLSNRRQAKQARVDEVAEYKANYQIDLMARLSQRGQQHEADRKSMMARKQKFRAEAASKSPEGGSPIKFVHTLSEMELKDHEAAVALTNKREAKAKRLEDEHNQMIKDKTAAL